MSRNSSWIWSSSSDGKLWINWQSFGSAGSNTVSNEGVGSESAAYCKEKMPEQEGSGSGASPSKQRPNSRLTANLKRLASKGLS